MPIGGAAKAPVDVSALAGTLTGTVDGTIADIAAPTDTPASADALRDDIATVMVPAINLQLKELQTKLNALIVSLKDGRVTQYSG